MPGEVPAYPWIEAFCSLIAHGIFQTNQPHTVTTLTTVHPTMSQRPPHPLDITKPAFYSSWVYILFPRSPCLWPFAEPVCPSPGPWVHVLIHCSLSYLSSVRCQVFGHPHNLRVIHQWFTNGVNRRRWVSTAAQRSVKGGPVWVTRAYTERNTACDKPQWENASPDSHDDRAQLSARVMVIPEPVHQS